jgi:hypothetical protein
MCWQLCVRAHKLSVHFVGAQLFDHSVTLKLLSCQSPAKFSTRFSNQFSGGMDHGAAGQQHCEELHQNGRAILVELYGALQSPLVFAQFLWLRSCHQSF